MKTCSKCKVEKNECEFFKSKDSRDGLYYSCKQCCKNYADSRKEELKKYRENHKEKLKNYFKEYNIKNRKKRSDYRKVYDEVNKEEIKAKNKIYYENNKATIKVKFKIYRKKRKIIDPLFKLRINITKLILQSLTVSGFSKKSKTANMLCCSYEEFQNHLGPKPEGLIHLDHICPCAQAQNEEELIKLQHYTNFRWLSAKENLDKSDKATEEGIAICLKLLGRDWIE